ncbi:MAG: hypothetical protein D6702_04360 [Planctomycetota bacterium]|nr:MAG: hypothetical protein D6702_04360 [Planctomycetota bacterium]
MKRRIYCTIPPALIKEPLLYTLGDRYGVVPNIRGASVTEEIAVLTLELEGEEESVAQAIAFLTERGVQIEDLPEGQSAP